MVPGRPRGGPARGRGRAHRRRRTGSSASGRWPASGSRRRCDGAERDRAIGELYEVVDAEVLDSLRGDEPFSSLVFIRERLDALMESWGGATLRVLRIPGAGSRAPLTLGLYSLTGVEGSGSLRVYAGTGAGAALGASSTHDGLLDARVWPAGPDRRRARVRGVERPARGQRGARAARGAVGGARARSGDARVDQRDPVARRPAGDGLAHPGRRARGALRAALSRLEARMRRAVRARGPLPARRGGRARAGAAAGRERLAPRARSGRGPPLPRARRGRRGAPWALLVPAPALRARLPRASGPSRSASRRGRPGSRGPVTVAATELRDGRRVPWALTWTRGPAGWRVQTAAPVLE